MMGFASLNRFCASTTYDRHDSINFSLYRRGGDPATMLSTVGKRFMKKLAFALLLLPGGAVAQNTGSPVAGKTYYSAQV
jgi:hypothetical protein